MLLVISIAVIVIISVILAVRSVEHELSVPEEVSGLKITKRKQIAGVILFFKKRIVHYSSSSS